MNVSLQDAYNLGWKLASVIQGVMDSRILETYQEERFPVAERLLAFDKRICGSICRAMGMSRKSQSSSYQQELETALTEENSSASGLTVRYEDNLLITTVENSDLTSTSHSLPISKQRLAKNIIVGARFPNHQVISQSDARPCQLQEQLVSSGQWYLIIFAGNIAEEGPNIRLQQLVASLGSPDRFVQKLIRNASERLVASVAVYLVHSAPRNSVELVDLPELFTPFNYATGYDYTRVFADSKSHRGSGGDAYESYGITPEGCLVLVRPDQHTAFIGGLTDIDSVDCFFARFVLV
jgi:phenol 2-monooxygenase